MCHQSRWAVTCVRLVVCASLVFGLGACSPQEKQPVKSKATLKLTKQASQNEARINELTAQVDQKGTSIRTLEERVAQLEALLSNSQSKTSEELASLQKALADARKQLATLEKDLAQVKSDLAELRLFTTSLERRILDKMASTSLYEINKKLLQEKMGKDWQINTLEGAYNVLLIPVEFSDRKFDDREFIATKAQEYLFGAESGSLSSYYRHASGGRLQVSGLVQPIVTVERPLDFYGAAVSATEHDKNAKDLVVDALKAVRDNHKNEPAWWNQFDQWDLNDYDGDGVFRERDGLIDAVVLIYAGKEESSCARYFPFDLTLDPTNPRYAAAMECTNRIWPHRSSVFLPDGHADKPVVGPAIEGSTTMAQLTVGMKITDSVYAFDYNMQSEYSDRSTFIHEFGHSLTFPDVYAVNSDFSNGSAYWTVMSSNSKQQAQEPGPLERMMVGWLNPRVIRQGENASAYLGRANFFDPERRLALRPATDGLDFIRRAMGFSDITAMVPGTDEPVYRALMVVPNPYHEEVVVATMPEFTGRAVAFSTHRDSATIGLKVTARVPAEGAQMLSFDTLYSVETETNFTAFTKDNVDVKIVTNYDVAHVRVNGKSVEMFQTLSGDANADTLAEMNPDCDASGVLALRLKKIEGTITPDEWKTFKEKYSVCVKPYWVRKSYDLSSIGGEDLRGRDVTVEIEYVTDAGAGMMGVMVDNLRIGSAFVEDFEAVDARTGDYMRLENGKYMATYNHFYLLDHRDPEANFGDDSYNMDRNIGISQAFFMPKAEGLTPRDRLRVVDIQYKAGVMAWYFNPRFDRRGNIPSDEASLGEGYYLPISSKVKEVPMPGTLGASDLFNAEGHYDGTTDTFKNAMNAQRDEFVCYGYTVYAKYLFGKDPDCASFEQSYLNDLGNIRMNGRKLVFNFQSINEYLPHQREAQFMVARPFSGMPEGETYLRQAMMAFRTPSSGMMSPFVVYKVSPGTTDLVVDEEMTAAAAKFAPMSTYRDRDNTRANAWWYKHPRFKADSPMVREAGLNFMVVDPDASVLSRFDSKTSPALGTHQERRPMAKVYMFWE